MSRKRQLEARRADAIKAARALTTVADAARRELTAEEQTQFEAHMASASSLKSQIAAEDALALEEAGLNADRTVDIGAAAVITTTNNAEADQKNGFKTFGEFLSAVRTGSVRNGAVDKRLGMNAAAPSSFGGEGVGADGGFLVPPAFSKSIFTLALTDDALLPLTDNTPVDGNGMVFPKDETTPWGTNGVRAYWQAEATAANATKPVFGTQAMRLHKLMALMPLTNELLDDSSSLGAYIAPLMARSIRWKTNEAILFGNGNGQPLGMFKGPAAIVQNKDAAQATNTLSVANVANMIARLPPGAFGDAIWLIAPDLLPLLFTLTLGNYPIYLPTMGGTPGLQGSPYGTLMGRPLYVSQHAPALSVQGDLSLIVPNWYRTITKSGSGVAVEQSMHLYFDADVTAFRATFRVDGSAKIAAPISQAKGANTLSPFVQLQAR